MISGKSILITGGTGSFGHAFVSHILKEFEAEKVIVFSRDEMKQWQMAQRFAGHENLRFFIGDVRDRDRLYRAVDGVDIVIHAAATKIVPTAEYNPFEAVKTNVLGAMNVIDACLDRGVQKVVALSTDKASSPINLYGATKLASDKMFTSAVAYAGSKNTIFSVVRYGNVMGSRGSVIPLFMKMKAKGLPLPITDPQMTRFMISLEEGVSLVETALKESSGGEIFVKKIPSMNIMDIADVVDPGGARQIIGIRPGEKLHEQMIGSEDSLQTWEFGDHFRIVSSVAPAGSQRVEDAGGKQVETGFTYSSNTNLDWMSKSELEAWVHNNIENMQKI